MDVTVNPCSIGKERKKERFNLLHKFDITVKNKRTGILTASMTEYVKVNIPEVLYELICKYHYVQRYIGRKTAWQLYLSIFLLYFCYT